MRNLATRVAIRMASRRFRFGVEAKKEEQERWEVEDEEALPVLEKTTRKLWQHISRLCS